MYGKTSALQRDAPDEASRVADFSNSLAWTNFQGSPPWAKDTRKGARRRLTGAKNDTSIGHEQAVNPVSFGLSVITGNEDFFLGNLFWCVIFTVAILIFHGPAAYFAKTKAKALQRESARLRVYERRASSASVKSTTKTRKDGASSMWGTLAETYPRIEIYIFIVCFQGLAQSTSATIVDSNSSSAARAFAFVTFAAVLVYGLLTMIWFVRRRVRRERRSVLICDENTGYHRWVDAAPVTSRVDSIRTRRHHTGFTAKYGAIWEDYKARHHFNFVSFVLPLSFTLLLTLVHPLISLLKNDGVSSLCMAAILTQRLLVGAFIGAMQVSPDPGDVTARERQTTCLIVVCGSFLFYIILYRPYLVPCANLLEGLVVCAQIACLSTNYGFVRESSVASANTVYWIMVTCICAMLLRLISVMIPVWASSCSVIRFAFCKLPTWHRQKARRDRKKLQRLKKKVRRAQQPHIAGPSVMPTSSAAAERGRAKMERAMRKIGVSRAFAHSATMRKSRAGQTREGQRESDVDEDDRPLTKSDTTRTFSALHKTESFTTNASISRKGTLHKAKSFRATRERENTNLVSQSKRRSSLMSAGSALRESVHVDVGAMRELSRRHAEEEKKRSELAAQEKRNRILHRRRLKARERRARKQKREAAEGGHRRHHRHRHKGEEDEDAGQDIPKQQRMRRKLVPMRSVRQSQANFDRHLERQASTQRLQDMVAKERKRRAKLREVQEDAAIEHGDSDVSSDADAEGTATPARRAGGTGYEATLGMKTHEELAAADEHRQYEDAVSLGARKPPNGVQAPPRDSGGPTPHDDVVGDMAQQKPALPASPRHIGRTTTVFEHPFEAPDDHAQTERAARPRRHRRPSTRKTEKRERIESSWGSTALEELRPMPRVIKEEGRVD